MFNTTRWKRMAVHTTLAAVAALLPCTSVRAQSVMVKPGDTLGNIAYRNQVTVEQLKLANHLASDMIYPGQSLYIPPRSDIYTIKPGDVLWKIAAAYQTTIPVLKEMNQLTSDTLIAGEKMLVPPTSPTIVYTVAKGDVLWKIADKYGVSIPSIVEANRLPTTDLLIGQKLIIPKASSVHPGDTQSDASPSSGGSSADHVQADKPWVEYIRYKVVKGDTSWSVAVDHHIPLSEFLETNHLSENDYLQVGQIVTIPVHHIPEMPVTDARYGEYLDWFEAAQYVFPINAIAKVTDFYTGKSFMVKRTTGAFHSDTEPLTSADSAIIKQVWGGQFSWSVRPVIVEVDGRRIAGSMTSMPHSVETILDNDFPGHFDIHFLNSLRHKDNLIDPDHQAAIRIAAGKN